MNRKRFFLYMLLFLLSSSIYFLNVSSSKYFSFIFDTFYNILLPITRLKTYTANAVKEAFNRYVYLVNVEKKNETLSKEIQELYLYRAELRSCETSLRSISDLLNIKREEYGKNLIFAGVLGYDPSGMDTFLLIDKGKDQGVEEGFVVFSKDRLVGFVDRVFGSSSRVRTVYSKDLTVSSTTEGIWKNYIYRGGWKYGQLLYVNLEDPIKKGDVVLLRDTRRVLPAFVIGTVFSVEQTSDQFFKKVLVTPSVDIRRLEYVVIVKVKL
ncbi:MAG: rod shape-determining protein MreC [Hydrogenobacter sp.]|uniref:rod shape-determining protein MreC n=1 Tax=Hydrogenobacter thermophilus TaxID=940 RepID=UPI0030F5686D